MTFKPSPTPGRWFGLLAMLALIGLDALLLRAVLDRPVDGLSFILVLVMLGTLLAIVYLGYRTLGAFTLEYWVDRNAVTIIWGLTRQIVPMGQIARIVVNPEARPLQAPAPWHWPISQRRRFSTVEFGTINAYSTRTLAQQVVLITRAENYSVSPADQQGFLDALQHRFALGPNRILDPELQRPPVWTWPLWRDRAALFLIAAGLLGVLIMFGALTFRYPELSSDLPMHFDVAGLPDRIAPKSELFTLPLIGLVVWVLNTGLGVWLYRHVQRGGAYLLWFGALTVQGIAGLALFNLMRW